jgi:multicomponent Na+:H+ antiporter subunit E
MQRLPLRRGRGTGNAEWWVKRGLPRAALFALLWWTLTGGDSRSWLIGVPVVLAAAVAAVMLNPVSRWQLSPAGLAGFVPHFLWRSIVGSFDVARRAFHPSLPISPALTRYPLGLPADGPARVFFAGIVNLLPGTLSAEFHDDAMTIHLLNGESPAALADLRRLEQKVGALFGLQLVSSSDSPEPPNG